jgi:hypothetical protein
METHAYRSAPPGGPPVLPPGGSLDDVRAVFWEAYRHLFPPHSLAAQTPQGSVVITWAVADEPDATYPYATPVVLRFDAALVEAVRLSDASQQLRVARLYEPVLRDGLRGYEPLGRFLNARVVTLG